MSWPRFPDGVLVGAQDLQAEVDDRLAQERQRLIDTADTGVAVGLVVSVNTVNALLVDLTAGRGYTPSGAQVELDVSLTGLALSDYTADTVNLICVQYSETDQWPGAHVSDGSTPSRRRARVTEAVVLTAAEYDALNVDAQNDTLVCGVVVAQGPTTALAASNLTTPTAVDRLVTVAQPNLPGLRIVGIDPTTDEGLAELTLNLAGANPAVSYTEPDDGSAGSPVAATGANDVETITCTGATAGLTIDVQLTKSLLPTSGSVSSQFAVTVAYEVRTRPAGGHDHLHRGQQGSGVATAANPHAGRSEELIPGSVALFRQLMASPNPGGASFPDARHAEAPQYGAQFSTVHTRSCMGQFRPISGLGGSPVRVYVTAAGALEWTINAYWDETASEWNKDRSGVFAARLRMGDSAELDDPIFSGIGAFAVDMKAAGENAAWTDGVGSSSEWTVQTARFLGDTGIVNAAAYFNQLSVANDIVAGGTGTFTGNLSTSGTLTVGAAMPTTPGNALYNSFLPCAFAEVTSGGASPTLSGARNVTAVYNSSEIDVTFNAPLTGDYIVLFQKRDIQGVLLNTLTETTTGFQIAAVNSNTVTGYDLSSSVLDFSFIVLGRVA